MAARSPADLDERGERGDDLDEAAARLLRSAWKSSPGVVLSVAFHGVILAVLPIIVFQEKIRELTGLPISIGVSAVRVDPERPYKPVSGGPPSSNGEGLQEPPVFDPVAVAAERNESKAAAGQEDQSTIDGESRAMLTHFASDTASGGFTGRLSKGPPGTNFVMGVGGGSGTGGARFGTSSRAAGRANLAARGGGSKHTEAAVEAGLSWLARHQFRDGSWRGDKSPCRTCKDEESGGAEVATTSLAVLAFLIAGYGPESQVKIKDRAGRVLCYGDTVRAGLNYLRSRQQAGSLIQSPYASHYQNIYEHGFATMALCEAYRVTKTADFKERAEKALKTLIRLQSSTSGGWCDTSVTGACLQGVRAARNAGLEVPEPCVDGIRRWFQSCCDSKTGTTGYGSRHDVRPAMNAIGLYGRRFLDPGKTVSDPFLPLAAQRVGEIVGSGQFEIDLYLWYYAMLALFEYEGPTGKNFDAVNKAVTTALVKDQVKGNDCEAGCWKGSGSWMSAYGRALPTAMSVLTLETYYRYVDAEKVAPIEEKK